jgi:hypothetical protein
VLNISSTSFWQENRARHKIPKTAVSKPFMKKNISYKIK